MEEVTEVIEEIQDIETEQVEQAENTEPSETKPEKTFTQKELDEIITKRLERERETVTKKTAQEARDAYIAEQSYEWNGNPIKTEAEYKQALEEQKLREKYSDLPEDVQNELIESKKFREDYTKQQAESQKQAKQQEDYKQFLETFPDTDPKDIPQTVWDEVNKGRSLVDSFTRHENQILKEKLAKLTETEKIEQQNSENAQVSTGSVTGKGDTKPVRFTAEQVAKMSQTDINKNWGAIQQSMKSPSWKT